MLPDELWKDVFDYLDPLDLVSTQRVSRRLSQLAHDSSIWRTKVFEKAPSASYAQASQPNALAALTGALGGLSIGNQVSSASTDAAYVSSTTPMTRQSRRAKAVANWDNTHAGETVDWYSEYVARHASLSVDWADQGAPIPEVRGMALLNVAEKVIGCLEDGSLAIWDIQTSQNHRRALSVRGNNKPGTLFQHPQVMGESSKSTKLGTYGTAVDNISVNPHGLRAYIAVKDVLNEVDLQTLQVVSQSTFAWPITALSQETDTEYQLTVGTSWSLHIHDSRAAEVRTDNESICIDNTDDSKIAFLPNYAKGFETQGPHATASQPHDAFTLMHRPLSDPQGRSNRIEAYARVEPGPQSILHLNDNEIVIAGRMPSILFYDRRIFPKLQSAIHSGARLASMTMLRYPPANANPKRNGSSTLIACGEYGGRGSLELYEVSAEQSPPDSTAERAIEGRESSSSTQLFSYKNRQEASSSKLLSVATQGARIVFSDSEGMIKWVERDGRGLARRWNINAFQMNERGASISGEQVVRKMIPLSEKSGPQGTKGDGDLLVWTGDRIGVVTTKPQPWEDHDELVAAFERGMNLNDKNEDGEQNREEEYAVMMRRALERQADERRWMSRFGGRRW